MTHVNQIFVRNPVVIFFVGGLEIPTIVSKKYDVISFPTYRVITPLKINILLKIWCVDGKYLVLLHVFHFFGYFKNSVLWTLKKWMGSKLINFENPRSPFCSNRFRRLLAFCICVLLQKCIFANFKHLTLTAKHIYN